MFENRYAQSHPVDRFCNAYLVRYLTQSVFLLTHSIFLYCVHIINIHNDLCIYLHQQQETWMKKRKIVFFSQILTRRLLLICHSVFVFPLLILLYMYKKRFRWSLFRLKFFYFDIRMACDKNTQALSICSFQ